MQPAGGDPSRWELQRICRVCTHVAHSERPQTANAARATSTSRAERLVRHIRDAQRGYSLPLWEPGILRGVFPRQDFSVGADTS